MGTQPNDPMMPNDGQGYPLPPPEPQSNDGRGLALAGLILGIVALVLFWIPLVNYVSLVLALVGLGLSIASLVIVRRRASGKGLSIAAVIVSAVALVAAILATVFWSSLFNTVDENLDTPLSPVTVTPTTPTVTPTAPAVTPTAPAVPPTAPAVTPTAPAVPTPAPTPTTTPTSGSTQRTATAAPNTEILPQGTEAEVGEYTVTVSSVQLDATDVILGFNQFNDPPQGQYVLVTLDVVYNGSEEGDPWLDLNSKFVGSDSRQYGESTCLATLEREGFSVPTLENGGAAQYEVCMDVPAAALPGKRVLVEDTHSFTGTNEASWQTE